MLLAVVKAAAVRVPRDDVSREPFLTGCPVHPSPPPFSRSHKKAPRDHRILLARHLQTRPPRRLLSAPAPTHTIITTSRRRIPPARARRAAMAAFSFSGRKGKGPARDQDRDWQAAMQLFGLSIAPANSSASAATGSAAPEVSSRQSLLAPLPVYHSFLDE